MTTMMRMMGGGVGYAAGASNTSTALPAADTPPAAASVAVDVLSLRSDDDGEVALLKAQLSTAKGDVAAAAAQLESNVKDIRSNTKEKIKKLRERVAAERKAKSWGFLGKLFKAIATIASAVSSVFTGGAGLVAAGLLVASMVVAHAAKNTIGKVISAVLGVAAAIVSLGSSAASAASSLVKGLTRAAKLTGSVAGIGTGVAAVGQGVEQKNNLDAQARLHELRALMTRVQMSNDDELEDMRRALNSEDGLIKDASTLLQKKNAATMPSL
ncbi:MAG: type III secretion system translocon subunit SctE [Myxococcales bacterium]|nr:type III secretion system translocon subunit SctE [Myxococcales bacterium]